jgi:hypothetical protein
MLPIRRLTNFRYLPPEAIKLLQFVAIYSTGSPNANDWVRPRLPHKQEVPISQTQDAKLDRMNLDVVLQLDCRVAANWGDTFESKMLVELLCNCRTADFRFSLRMLWLLLDA